MKSVGRMVEEGSAWYLVPMFCKVVIFVRYHDDDEDDEDADADDDDRAPVGMQV